MYRRMTMMKQTIAVLLALFCLTLCLAALAEAPQVFTVAPEVQQVTGLGENTNTAAEGYIRKVFGLPDLAPVSPSWWRKGSWRARCLRCRWVSSLSSWAIQVKSLVFQLLITTTCRFSGISLLWMR